MEGEIIKIGDDWFVKFEDYAGWGLVEIVNRELPLHPENLNQLKEYQMIFDNIEGRILSNPKVKFDIVEVDNDEKSNNTETKIYAKVQNF